jgi:hypothetical protein
VQEKPLSIALREVNAGVLQYTDTDAEEQQQQEQPGLSAVQDVPSPQFDDSEPSA